MEKYCVFFAMKEEAGSFIKDTNAQLIETQPFEVYCSKNIYIAISNIGLINAAACFSFINSKYDFTYYINAGLVGCVQNSSLQQLDLVLIEKAFLGNVNATGFGYKLGQIPRMPEFYTSNNEFLKLIKTPIVYANICSSDIFISSQDLYNDIVAPIDNSIELFDMECASFFQSAFIFKKPIISLKIISDKIGNIGNELQFSDIILKASKKISQLLLNFWGGEKNE